MVKFSFLWYPVRKVLGEDTSMTDTQRRAAAKQFAADWAGKGYEKGHSQTFWLSLLQKVYEGPKPDKFITFENQVVLDHTSFIVCIMGLKPSPLGETFRLIPSIVKVVTKTEMRLNKVNELKT